MSPDSSARDVAIAEFQYRYEAELAAGFLEDAGIPFRIQADDAGGMESISRPARLWVRGEHADTARELLEIVPEGAILEPRADEGSEWHDAGSDSGHEAQDPERPASGLFVRPEPAPASRSDQGRLPARPATTPGSLCGVERALAGGLGGVLLGFGLGVTPVVLGTLGTVIAVLLGSVLGVSAVLGRTWGPLRSLLRALSGAAP